MEERKRQGHGQGHAQMYGIRICTWSGQSLAVMSSTALVMSLLSPLFFPYPELLSPKTSLLPPSSASEDILLCVYLNYTLLYILCAYPSSLPFFRVQYTCMYSTIPTYIHTFPKVHCPWYIFNVLHHAPLLSVYLYSSDK